MGATDEAKAAAGRLGRYLRLAAEKGSKHVAAGIVYPASGCRYAARDADIAVLVAAALAPARDAEYAAACRASLARQGWPVGGPTT